MLRSGAIVRLIAAKSVEAVRPCPRAGRAPGGRGLTASSARRGGQLYLLQGHDTKEDLQKYSWNEGLKHWQTQKGKNVMFSYSKG